MRRDYLRDPDKYKTRAKIKYAKNKDKAKEYNAKYKEANKEKVAKINADWQKRNPRKVKENNLKRTGFTLELFETRLQEQNWYCAICEKDLLFEPTKHVHADHCHKTETPRGILCHACNTGIGSLNEDLAILQKAINYLMKWRTENDRR